MSELGPAEDREQPPPYIIFVVVSLFFLMGLLGFLICHLLKKKGYRCRTIGDLDDEVEEKLGANADYNDEHQDTVEQILKCIIENEANMEAFNEMLESRNICVRHDPRLRKESIAGIPSHHHTVHSGTDINSCHLCALARSKKGRRQSRTPHFKQRPGEQTVFSVGRFRVTHHDKKLQGGPNPSVSSGDQLDQSEDSEDRKESGYNLRSMFKDIQPPLDTSNRIVPNTGKRRKSITLFGLRRGSDPAGSKVAEGAGKETGGIMFTGKNQPAVLEELEYSTKPKAPLSPDHKANTSEIVDPFPACKNQFQGFVPATEGGSIQSSSPVPCMRPGSKSPLQSTAASVPSCLPIQSPLSSAKDLMTEKHRDVVDLVLPTNDAGDLGPLQTSTPFAPVQGTISGYTAAHCTNQSNCYPNRVFLVNQTPPDLSSSTDIESSNSLALVRLGSSNTPTTETNSDISSAKAPPETATNLSAALVQSPSFSSSKMQEGGVGLPKVQEKK
ncbi:RELT-like protein 2 isoform X2 [Takifugu rubripes]|uniref:RELT-like protein 2 n=2 Tax=Takifugu rubripes TaxID=31033 RepID=A0A3B5JVR4_TAKRU|nr:RELT-like protein 2 isoform X2 [Takifugu rubripes]XP_011616423.1 RELT-like protein 2 isoform X2 [Takifugu rubripes]XP_029688392.1 RELT-like protein 2 isoform X2 [Takifugu rubripes]XP_029703163.1 RELT-like protein 2 isoform X2 [Takifugu rubripes]XP_029703164.1 RELT-like protein 2 isoform X2 [Takifugu rubripes]|eukprot:XP_011616422.1 PREDICTED: RELT-like protein 2 [Takifugu rubripes]